MARDGRREQQPREAKLNRFASFLNRDVSGLISQNAVSRERSFAPTESRPFSE
jgi:hypothetical protein